MPFSAWRRVPEFGACPWCLMLATRGAVYRSQTTAKTARGKSAYHRHCKCRAELETRFDQRTDIRTDPGDANRIITNRVKDRQDRYDLSRYRNLGITNPPKPPRPQAPQPAPWVKLNKSEVAARFAADSPRVRAFPRTTPDPSEYKVYVQGPVEVRVADAAKWSQKEIDVLQARIEQVFDSLPSEVMGVDVRGRPYVIWIGDWGRKSYGFTGRGLDHVWLNSKLMRRALTESGDIYNQGEFKMPSLAASDQLTYTLTHELGHTMDLPYDDTGWFTGKLDSSPYAPGRIRKDNVVKRLLEKVLAGDFGDSAALSEYGRSKAAESYAEAFAEWCLGDRSNPVVAEYAEVFRWTS